MHRLALPVRSWTTGWSQDGPRERGGARGRTGSPNPACASPSSLPAISSTARSRQGVLKPEERTGANRSAPAARKFPEHDGRTRRYGRSLTGARGNGLSGPPLRTLLRLPDLPRLSRSFWTSPHSARHSSCPERRMIASFNSAPLPVPQPARPAPCPAPGSPRRARPTRPAAWRRRHRPTRRRRLLRVAEVKSSRQGVTAVVFTTADTDATTAPATAVRSDLCRRPGPRLINLLRAGRRYVSPPAVVAGHRIRPRTTIAID
jgi:hypothetical protein